MHCTVMDADNRRTGAASVSFLMVRRKDLPWLGASWELLFMEEKNVSGSAGGGGIKKRTSLGSCLQRFENGLADQDWEAMAAEWVMPEQPMVSIRAS